jgi:protein-disulfide isomerase
MSKANKDGKRLARERVAQMRIEQARRARRNRLWTIYGSVAGVLVVAVVAAFIVQNATKPTTPALVPAGAVADTTGGVSAANGLAIPIGDSDAPVKLTVYEDFRCPDCKSYETTFEASYKPLIANGTLELLIHPVNLIDNNQPGTSGSVHAGNAAGCAQDAGHFEAYHDILYTNQPDETTDGYSSNATLISLAKQVPGLDSPTFEACVNSGKYDDWIKQNYLDLEQVDGSDVGTPTLLANGTKLTLTTPAAFVTQINKLAAGKPKGAPIPTAGASASASGSASAPATTSPATASPSASAS